MLRFTVKSVGFNLDKVVFKKSVVTGAESQTELESFSVFPNPSESGIFHLSSDQQYVVINTNGIELTSGEGNTIDLSAYAKGVYLLRIENKIFKLVK